MRLLLLVAIGCHAAPPPAITHQAAPAPTPHPAPAPRAVTQDLIDKLEANKPFDEEAMGLQRSDQSPEFLGAQLEDGFYPVVRFDNHWVSTAKPILHGERVTLHATLFTGSLTRRSMAYILSSYDGGSETGVERTTLIMMCADPKARAVHACGQVDLGYFMWALAAEHRREYPGAATSLNARPHVEVALQPSYLNDMLRLDLRTDDSTLGEIDDDTRGELARIRANAGRWKITGETLVRN